MSIATGGQRSPTPMNVMAGTIFGSVQGDALAPPLTGRFDAIVSFETIEHLDEPEQFLQTCREFLAPDGTFFVSTPYRDDMDADGRPLNPFHKQEWRTEEFEALLRPWFRSVEMYGQALKLKKRRFQLNRRWAAPLAWLQGCRLRDPRHLYRLPGPRASPVCGNRSLRI